ncbi:hypothetical protein SAZ10_04040 [Mesorhizobium sp. BAC0120]|uniref:hypothetical protein n=1 Tax=Mesorhizobium sp. BAC0120 TaxID=3090670 RepID=UPI00298D438E|nr:hypothetical protein [Mesorhizobium sp. BAC0120]MDW6020928.1 hypothetical protein [Mesorhizobium sp. BAC0120]
MKGVSLGNNRFLPVTILFGFMLAAAGCQSGDSAAVVDPATGQAAKAPDGKVLQSELRAYCPPVTLREGTAFFNTYETKRKKGDEEQDPAKLVYQSSIIAVTRQCSYAPGTITMNVAVAGRVVPGPAAKDGTVTMPIRVVVMRGSDVLYSNLAKYQVTVNKTAGATQFVYNDANVTFPTPEPGTVQVFAGYDEGPSKKGDKGERSAEAQSMFAN